MNRYALTPAGSAEVAAKIAAHDYECIRLSKTITASDLAEEVSEACDALLAAVNTGKPELVGAVVLAVHKALLDRLADRELETELERPVYADDAAMRVLLAASVEMAAANRAATGVAA